MLAEQQELLQKVGRQSRKGILRWTREILQKPTLMHVTRLTGEPHLAEEVLNTLPYDANPLNLSWIILLVENEDEINTLFDHMSEWVQIIKEEIRKYGVEPGDFFYDSK